VEDAAVADARVTGVSSRATGAGSIQPSIT